MVLTRSEIIAAEADRTAIDRELAEAKRQRANAALLAARLDDDGARRPSWPSSGR